MVDIPLDSLKGLESGRLSFTPKMWNRILCETGATWNQEDKRWRFGTPDGPLYTRLHYDQYRQGIEQAQKHSINLDVFLAQERIRLLLETLSPKARFKFFFRLNTFLEGARKEFCPEQFAELFRDMSSFIEIRPELDRAHPLAVMRGYPSQIMSRISWEAPEKLQTAPELNNLPLEELEALTAQARPILFDLKGYQEAVQAAKEGVREEPKVSARARRRRPNQASPSSGVSGSR
jgi:hypothetical protein